MKVHEEGPAAAPDALRARAGAAPTSERATPDPGLDVASVMGLQAQAGNRAVAALVQRQHIQTASGSFVGDVGGPTNNLREEVLPVMDRLHMLWSMPNADYDAEYPGVASKPAKTAIASGDLPRTRTALKKNETGDVAPAVSGQFLRAPITEAVGQGQKNQATDVQAVLKALLANDLIAGPDYVTEWVATSAGGALKDAQIPKTIAAIAKMKMAAAAGTFRRDLFAGTAPLSATTQADVSLILHPGTTLVPGIGGAPPTIKMPPKMKGGGVGGQYEIAMVKAMDNFLKPMQAKFLKLKAKPPAFPIAGANDIAAEAQKEAERYFGGYAAGASRTPGAKYHPGAYSLTAKLGDQSARPLADPDRAGWVQYFMTTKGYGGQEVMDKLNVHPDMRPAKDGVEFSRVLDWYVKNRTALIDDAVHSWPAEAGTGTVFIQPYGDSNPKKVREQRWEVFTTLIHEFMHILEHEEFGRVAGTIGGNGERILFEGFAELMRYDLWTGPGALKSRIGSDELAPLREKVEGGSYPYDPAVVVDSAAYSELAEARDIASKVGMANAKAAFFLGHTELIGLGSWKPTDAAGAESYVVGPGETEASIKAKTKATTLLDAAGKPLAGGAAVVAGSTIKIPGIRYVEAINGDMLATVARQHDVDADDLAVANGLAKGTPRAHVFPVGTRILIPVHGPVSP